MNRQTLLIAHTTIRRAFASDRWTVQRVTALHGSQHYNDYRVHVLVLHDEHPDNIHSALNKLRKIRPEFTYSAPPVQRWYDRDLQLHLTMDFRVLKRAIPDRVKGPDSYRQMQQIRIEEAYSLANNKPIGSEWDLTTANLICEALTFADGLIQQTIDRETREA